jgi:hypothetical protein
VKESDLYPPLKRFLESQGYEVKGEVKDCDVVAVRGQDPAVIVELKLLINLDVILQAVDRLALTPTVYIGIPERSTALKRRLKPLRKLLRMLGLGLLAINPRPGKGRTTVLLDPGEYRPRKSKPRTERLLGEFTRRIGDPNPGGMVKRNGILTVYRQRALAIARVLATRGPTKASEIARETGDPGTRGILYGDPYGWFDRRGGGIYALSPRGSQEIPAWLSRIPAQG